MQKTCLRCGKLFEAGRHLKKYCTDTCRQYAYLERHGLQIRKKEQVETSTACSQRMTELESELERLKVQISVLSGCREKETETIVALHTPKEIQLVINDKVSGTEKLSEKTEVNQCKEESAIRLRAEQFTSDYYAGWSEADIKNAAWVDERVKSHCKRLLEMQGKEKHIKYVKYIIEAFHKLSEAPEYKLLPFGYPYKPFIKKVVSLLKQFVRDAEQNRNRRASLMLSNAMYSEMICVCRKIGNSVPDVDHSIPSKAKKPKISSFSNNYRAAAIEKSCIENFK